MFFGLWFCYFSGWKINIETERDKHRGEREGRRVGGEVRQAVPGIRLFRFSGFMPVRDDEIETNMKVIKAVQEII